MRIAQVSPLFESVPPKLYGGTERVVSYLTEELVAQGHDVTLFASADSVTRARLVAVCERSLRLDTRCTDRTAHHIHQLEEVYRRHHDFEVIHFHTDYLHFPVSSRIGGPRLTTLHGRLDLPELAALYHDFPDEPLVSISAAQRDPLPWVNWQTTVHHGLPPEVLSFHPESGRYLAYLGRMSPEKRPDRAITVARKTGWPLKMAAKVDAADQAYFDGQIRPLLSGSDVEFVGEIDETEKDSFLGNAAALLFPIDWPEPFGLVMIEALACGTPVVAWRCGSVPEVIEDGVNGFVVDDLDGALDAVGRLGSVARDRCRASFDERFSAARMTRDYVRAFRRVLWSAERPWRSGWTKTSSR